MRAPSVRPGTIGWIVLALYVVVWDRRASETLSGAFARAIKHPRARWPVIVAWAITTAHLFDTLPNRVDPFDGVALLLDAAANLRAQPPAIWHPRALTPGTVIPS